MGNKKRTRAIVCAVVAILCLTTALLTACKDKDNPVGATGLAAPVISLHDGVISWKAIDGAEGYIVNVNGAETQTTDTSFTLPELEPGAYKVFVTAFKTDGEKKVYSEKSNQIDYTINSRFDPDIEKGEVALDIPGVTLDQDILRWDVVHYATAYRIYIDGKEHDEVETNYYKLYSDKTGTYDVTVKAVSSYEKYAASAISNTVSVTIDKAYMPITVSVMDAPYNAKGDGKTNDREAIQKAVDYVHEQGGGTVVLPGNRTYLTASIFLKDNVTIQMEDGVVVKQSANPKDYYEWTCEGGYVQKDPWFGGYVPKDVDDKEWAHTWKYNYGLIAGIPGTRNIGLVGKGTLKCMNWESEETTMRICIVGFGGVDYYKLTDFTISDYTGYAVTGYGCHNVLIRGLTIKNYIGGCNDGLSIANASHMRIADNYIASGDDSIDIGIISRGAGKDIWIPIQAESARNIEIANNYCHAGGDNMKGIALFLWASEEDMSSLEVSDVNIHDNKLHTVGIWSKVAFPYGEQMPTPVKNIRWYDNDIDIVLDNFYDDAISDMNLFQSMRNLYNGNFETCGIGCWSTIGAAGVKTEDNNTYGFIEQFENGEARIYEGLYLNGGQFYRFAADVKSGGEPARLFVRDLDTGALIASKEFSNTEWQRVEMEFVLPASANYHIGIESGRATSGFACIDNATLTVVSGRQCTITTDTPAEAKNDTEGEFGLRFTPTTYGVISRVRLYTTAIESGNHTVTIWDAAGHIVAGPYDWDIIGGYAGWKEYELPQALVVKPDSEYTLSVSNSADKIYFVTNDYYTENKTVGSLYITKGAGVRGEKGAKPGNSEQNACYFRDIVFTSSEQHIMTSQAPNYFVDDPSESELGVIFAAVKDGVINKALVYARRGENNTKKVTIWNYQTGEKLSGPYDWHLDADADGWYEFVLPQVVYVQANVKYVVSVTNGTQFVTPHGDGTNGFEKPMQNGDLVAFIGSGVYGAVGAMPRNVFQNTNYMRDVSFIALDVLDEGYQIIRREAAKQIEALKNSYVAVNIETAESVRAAIDAIRPLTDRLNADALAELDMDFVNRVTAELSAFDAAQADPGQKWLYGATVDVGFDSTEGEKLVQDILVIRPNSSSLYAPGMVVKVAYYIDIESVTSGAWIRFDPILQRDDGNWTTVGAGYNYVPITGMSISSGKIVIVFVTQMADAYDANTDAYSPRLCVNGIKGTIEKVLVSGCDRDFGLDEEYKLASETACNSMEFTVSGNWTASTPYTAPSPAVDDRIFYDANSDYTFDNAKDTDGEWIQGLNLMPSAGNQLTGGQVIKVAYFMNLTNADPETCRLLFSPLLQRQSTSWGTTGETAITVNFSDMYVTSGKVVFVFVIQLSEGFDAADDAISPRLQFHSACAGELERIVIAGADYDFGKVEGYTLACEVVATENTLAVSKSYTPSTKNND